MKVKCVSAKENCEQLIYAFYTYIIRFIQICNNYKVLLYNALPTGRKILTRSNCFPDARSNYRATFD